VHFLPTFDLWLQPKGRSEFSTQIELDCTKTLDLVRENIGKKVTLTGKAANAKAGAVVECGSDPVYIDGLDSWPDETLGKVVLIVGVFKRAKLAPDPVYDKQGRGINQGISGESWVIVDAEWHVVEK
jgi:hypothetical protein